MSTRPERPAQAPSAHPGDSTSAVPSPSIPRPDSVPLTSAARALSECSGALALVQVTARSLESQDIGCAEQEVLTRTIQTLWAVHDWLYDRMWSDIEAERGRDRECQP
jgi:hypothetical protein